jgi:hypothetical protein
MGGLYNVLFGTNSLANALLNVLWRVQKFDSGRFRDAYLNEDGTQIVVYTRNGGGNREYQEEAITSMQNHPCYLRDEDDDFDCTYAYFYFKVPDEDIEMLKPFVTGENPPTVSERFLKLVAEMDAQAKGKAPQ